MKELLIGVAIFLAVILLTFGGLLLVGYIHGETYVFDAPEHVELEANKYNTVTAVGTGLYDEKGDRFDIKGINFGNLFVTEAWMSINSMGAEMNPDGSYVKTSQDGNFIVEEYNDIYQDQMDCVLGSRFTAEQLKTLNDAYFNAYCTPADFALISDMGMNTVRLPVYYRTFLTTEVRYKLDNDGDGIDELDDLLCEMNFEDIELVFDQIDTFLEYAKAEGLKVIIDMHGVMGGQSSMDHSGSADADFWKTEEYIEFMCKLWKAIAVHYTEERPDLASTVLAYDLVNEPTIKNDIGTLPYQWDVMDRLYDAIREVDPYHVISIEGVWFPASLPRPERYGWENVLYQCHYYNWDYMGTSNELFYSAMFAMDAIFNHEVPKLVGEFTFFGDQDAWVKYLNQYDKMGWGWTIWNYKIISVGYWDNSWGLVVQKLHLYNKDGLTGDPATDTLKLDIRTASYEEILAAWSNQKTAYGDQEGVYTFVDSYNKDGSVKKYGDLYSALTRYFDQLDK